MKNIEIMNSHDDNKFSFNPNDIKVRSVAYTLGMMLDDIFDNVINLNTVFQRHSSLWNIKQKSRFIESILLNIPIPSFYFAEGDYGGIEIIDGLQRISSLKEFVIDQSFKLENLEFLSEYTYFGFSDLPRDLQRRIKTFQIMVYVIEKKTPNTIKYNIFSRINQGGLAREPQEIRNALHQGLAAGLVEELVSAESNYGKAFLLATANKIKSHRMEDRDFATRFIAFYVVGYKKYQPNLDTFMNNGMAEIAKLSANKINELKTDFEKAMHTAYSIFEDDAFRKRFKISDNKKPINKALFEVLSVNFAKLSDEERSLLASTKRKLVFKEKLMALFNHEDGRFLRSISQGTAQKQMVEQRFKDIEQIIKETLTL